MENSSKPLEETFKSITVKMVLSQLYKSRDIITIAMIRNTKILSTTPLEDYCMKLTRFVNALAKPYSNLEEIPASRYVEPSIHLSDIVYYLTSQRKLFKSKHEQIVIDKIILLMNQTKKELVYEED